MDRGSPGGTHPPPGAPASPMTGPSSHVDLEIMTLSRIARGLLLSSLPLASMAPAASADSLFGGRVGLYTHRDQPYFGVEGVIAIGHGFAVNPNVEYVR